LETKFITNEKLKNFINSLEGEIFIPQKVGDTFHWSKYPSEFTFEGFRTILPPKFFFYSPQEILKEKETPKRTVIGIKACDLRGILFLRKVFKEGDFVDPFFRNDILIISSDCTYTSETCFCTLLGNNPYPEEGFDLNLSKLKDGYLVDIGSDRGRGLVEAKSDLFSLVDPQKTRERDIIRERVKKQIVGKRIEINGDIEPEKIANEINKCVSCGACTNICPGCFCFLLNEAKNLEKVRYWDSCQYPGYARVAGGANPRKKLDKRFVHRIKCKFEYSPVRFGLISCFGCGRCIPACYGGINFKDVLQSL
jgi:hypothetical protein